MPGSKSQLPTYIAIDFETAGSYGPSACSVGLARFENGELVAEYYNLIRPPSSRILFTWVHGLTWDDLKDAPDFAKVWQEGAQCIGEAEYFVAHNAPFDSRVLYACCDYYDLDFPVRPFLCTLKAARRALSIESYNLETVSGYFGFELDHHNAASDARNCGRVLAKLLKMGISPAEIICKPPKK